MRRYCVQGWSRQRRWDTMGWETGMINSTEDRWQTLHELIAAARLNLSQNLWDYLIGGAATETTVRRNRLAGWSSLALAEGWLSRRERAGQACRSYSAP